MRKFRCLAIASVSLLAIAMPAYAQDVAAAEGEANDEDIVVVGTSLRKVAPAGAQEFTVTAQAIEGKSVQSTSQLLATIPQLSSFGNLQTVNAGGSRLTVNRVNLRNLPQGIGGSSPTLVLMDGHRMVGAGVVQSYPDPDVIPPLLIERVDVLTDGGSAIYGSDAMGGVINFTTKRNFDGIQIGARQSFADAYSATDVNFAAGKSWETGSAYIAYNFARHDDVFGADRDYIKDINWTTGLPNGLGCSPANVTVGGVLYAVVGGNSLSAGNANRCDRSDVGAFYPEETRHSVMAGFRQDLTDSIEIDVKGYYSNRENANRAGPLEGVATVLGANVPANPGFPPFVPATPAQSANPNYISIGGGSTATQTLNFDFGPVGGNQTIRTKLWSWGITPTITWKIGGDWQMKAFYNHGESKTTSNNPSRNDVLLGAGVAAGTINPYNIARSNPAAIAQVLDWVEYGIGKSKLSNAKVTFDGPLVNLPGGELRVAVGGEYLKESFAGTVTTDTAANVLLRSLNSASRNVKAAFAEAAVPVIGPEMNWPIHSLNLSASVRYDKYSDFGSNWAPNLGVSLKPVEWLNLRARWNKSFQAPSVVNLSNAAFPNVGVNQGFIVAAVPQLRNPAVPHNGGPLVAVQGTVSPLSPQRAKNYNLGFDISPPFIEGLDLHMTYFNIDYRGTIGTPALGFGEFYTIPGYQSLFIMLPTNAQIGTFLAGTGATPAQIANALAQIPGNNAYVVADVRARNLGVTKTNGFDFSANYRTNVSFGTVYANFNGTLLNHSITAADGTNFTVEQAGLDGAAFNSTLTLGTTVGENFRGQVTWNHRSGFRLLAPAGLGQTTIGTFDTFDLFMAYDVKRDGLPPINLSLGVTNMLNTSPPIFRGRQAGGQAGFHNGSTLGRVFQLGAGVKF